MPVHPVRLPDGTCVPVATAGPASGPATVLVHGLTDSWRSFAPVLPALRGRTVAVTLRGHGDADRPRTGYHPDELAADVLAVLDALGVGTATVVGHSLGASVALRVAAAQPARTDGLVLLGAFATPATNPVVDELVALVDTLTDPVPHELAHEFQASTVARPLPPGRLEAMVAETRKVPAHVWRAATLGFRAADNLAVADQVEAPVCLVRGDEDALVPEDDQQRLAEALADVRRVRLAGIGHAPHWEEPERVVAEIERVQAAPRRRSA